MESSFFFAGGLFHQSDEQFSDEFALKTMFVVCLHTDRFLRPISPLKILRLSHVRLASLGSVNMTTKLNSREHIILRRVQERLTFVSDGKITYH